MPNETLVSKHYSSGSLLQLIEAGIKRLGKTTTTITVDDLAPVDEFHIGGRAATISFLDQLALNSNDSVLDVGCGLGGSSRFVASHYQSHVTGIDLTEEYIQTAQTLSRWVGLEDHITFEQGSATALPYEDESFDKAYMMHVGMNIADKASLAKEVFRVLKPGGQFGIYDVMLTAEGDLKFPVPWATTAEGSSVDSPDRYRTAVKNAGFRLVSERNQKSFALDFFEQLKKNTAQASGPPPLGLHLVMGETAPQKVKNMIENIAAGLVAPYEIIAQKP